MASAAQARGIRFLLAGDHAVIAHGFPRSTFDLDLIISREDKEHWLQLAKELGYTLHHEVPAFLQLNPSQSGDFPLDLMLVSEQTFQKLCADAIQNTAWPGVNIVSLPSLLALKCHAVKHGGPGRIVKDADDAIRLSEANRLDPESPNLRDIFQKYGTESSTKKCCEPAPRTEPAELEFPDWSGMDDGIGRITPEAALRAYRRSTRSSPPPHEVESLSDPSPVPWSICRQLVRRVLARRKARWAANSSGSFLQHASRLVLYRPVEEFYVRQQKCIPATKETLSPRIARTTSTFRCWKTVSD